MAFVIAGNNGGGNFANHPAGVFPARCTRIVDLGTQDEEYLGKPKKMRKLVLFFETNELMTEGEHAGKPFLVNREFTVALNDKATLRKFLESWRSRKFSEAEIQRFEISSVLGKPLMLNIVEYQKRNGDTSTKIDGCMPLPAGMIANKAVGDLIEFSLYDDTGMEVKRPLDQEAYDALSDFWKGKIAKSPEYAVAMGKAPAQSSTQSSIDDDDIPF